MFLFGYEHEWGMVGPRDDDVRRVLVFDEEKNNVLVWRGFKGDITHYTIDMEAIWDIRGLLEGQSELTDAEKTDIQYIPPLDVSEDSFVFMDGEGRFRSFSDGLLFEEKEKDAGINLIVNMIFKIQRILQKNGVDVTMLDEGDLEK